MGFFLLLLLGLGAALLLGVDLTEVFQSLIVPAG
jgi:hypothetical protein